MGGICVHVIAHRGASAVERENTIEAFRRAAAMGADAVELDVRRSAAGVLVVHHDAYLPDAGRAICTLDELPAHVPTLGEALDACAGMWVNVEIKNDAREPDFDPTDSIADETVAHLLARGTDDRWLISSFRLETVDRCRALAPVLRTAWLVGAVPADAPAVLVERGHGALHPWVERLDRATVDACHAAGLQVNTWTCDDPVRMAELIGWGIDGICTNVPDVALRVRDGAAARG
jgi:glycerophosphoryl diester phosphodiesterase